MAEGTSYVDPTAYVGPEATQAKTPPQVWDRFERIEERTDQLHKGLANLSERVGPVMSPAVPSEAPNPRDESAIPIVARLEAHERRLTAAVDAVVDIINRLEI